MKDKVVKYIEEHNMLNEGDSVVVGVSGGADSMALFEVLLSIRESRKLSIYVVHINHGIRQEAEHDALFVEEICKQKNVPFYLFSCDIPAYAAEHKCTEEEAGRIYRYDCFEKVMNEKGAKLLAVAHHLDDQAETVLFNLVRGSNISGASGMAPKSKTSKGYEIIRPLLCVRKNEITTWLNELGMNWCEDYTNTDVKYTRNRIRHDVVPTLETINSQAVLHIADFARQAGDIDEYIREQALDFIGAEGVFDSDKASFAIPRKKLLQKPGILISRILYEALTAVSGARKDITSEHVDALYELLSLQSGKKINLPYGVIAKTSYDTLVICKDENSDCDGFSGEVVINVAELKQGEPKEARLPGTSGSFTLEIINDRLDCDKEKLQKNYTKYFDCDKIKNTLSIRYPSSEDYLIIDNRGHTKKLSKYFKDEKLPADNRKKTPVVAVDKEILWIVGGRRCESYKVTQSTKNIIKITYKGE
ncbi:MAG: tRNA lysidine(34) synthetase TilS [Lachnospiraceae bacterium]|nr:tRNA lysidine(34) synthetase TilS [Lachnospiraceae bacterium]